MTAQQFTVSTDQDMETIFALIRDAVREFGAVDVSIAKTSSKSSMPMKRLWRMWMAETAKWMAAQGATMPLYFRPNGEAFGKRPFNKDDAHEAFMRAWGLVDGEGEREHQEAAKKGVMLHIMDRHFDWCVSKGLALTIPKTSEYARLRDQEA